MQVIFSFDTEDYVDPVSNDSLLRLAQIHTRYGVPACFGLVGEKARFLRACGRRDVIEAVGRHEVAYHSDHHFLFADETYEQKFLPEYMEVQPWDRGITRLLAEESRGIRDIAEIFGRRPATWLRTFGDWAAHYSYTYSRLGLPIYAYGPRFHAQDCMPIWYCNQLAVANPRLMYEQNLHNEEMTPQEMLEEHKANFLKHLEGGTPRLGFVNHPTRFISDIWWETPNWWYEILDPPPRAQWKVPPRFSPEKTESLLWIAEEFVRFVGELDDVEFLTFIDFLEPYGQQSSWVTRQDLSRLASGLHDRPAYQTMDGQTFSPAELFGAFAYALAEPEVQEIPVRQIIGPTEDPVETPPGCSASEEAFVDACRCVELGIRDRNRVPHAIEVGSASVGPGGFLLAMARALQGKGESDIDIPPAENLPVSLHEDDYDVIAGANPASYMQKQGEFDMPNARQRVRLQYWTVKPAARSQA
ncbi:MAG: hypothetical protein QGI83_02390 [Candidatus Latescibacteria bacterium]|nr:hypothetical protein [Candidatus Latescibacterota bacterium]